jgi:hypothetical protein
MQVFDYFCYMQIPEWAKIFYWDEPITKALWKRAKKGDQRCLLKIGDRVIKIRQIDEKEVHPIGSLGIIVGSIYYDDPPVGFIHRELYILHYDGDDFYSASVGWRLQKLNEN